MKKLAVLNSFAAWLILSVALMLFSGPAQAYVYDHFTSNGINTNLWSDVGPNTGLFSQPGNGDTYLYFSDTSGGQIDKLKSYAGVSGAFFVSMQYSNFQATNSWNEGMQVPWQASNIQLTVAEPGNGVFVFEGQKGENRFFQATFSNTSDKENLCQPISTSVNSGWLGIGYNGILGPGGQVTLWYKTGTEWTELATYAPNFSHDPYFLITGYDPYPTGQSLSFRVNQVQLTPVPPASCCWEPASWAWRAGGDSGRAKATTANGPKKGRVSRGPVQFQ